MISDLPELLTVDEVADFLRVERQTVKRYIRLGKLKAIRLSSHITRIRRSELEMILIDTDDPS